MEQPSLHRDFFMEKALSRGISCWNRLFVEWFLYGKGFYVKAFWNRLFVEWFLYGTALLAQGFLYGKGSF